MASDEIVVSVICTCFNKGKWITQALESVLAQKTSFSFELIVIDDASTDDSLLAIEAVWNKHKDQVRILSHAQNKGIAATWVEACCEAKGKYIARLDGDDYWTSDSKLEEQVSLLEAHPDSKWCSTDFDMVDEAGALVCRDALATGAVATIDSYEHMLAVKGSTIPSTWLVDSKLMLEVNEGLDGSEADDTFSIQLDLFHSTKLTRIDSSMCAIRVNIGSDSRPMSFEDAKRRYKGIEKQQLHYLEKYQDVDFACMARFFVEQDTEKHIHLFASNEQRDNLKNELAQRDAEIEYLRSSSTLDRIARGFKRKMRRQ